MCNILKSNEFGWRTRSHRGDDNKVLCLKKFNEKREISLGEVVLIMCSGENGRAYIFLEASDKVGVKTSIEIPHEDGDIF